MDTELPAPRVLLVEDDRDTREMYALYLEQSGCAVDQAHNGNQAFAKAAEQHPDIVVTDLALPGIDGFSLCKRLKLDERTREVPVIALTGRFMTVEDITRARNDGCESVLVKPCLPETLLSEIQRVVRQGHAARQRVYEARERADGLLNRSGRMDERSSALRDATRRAEDS